MGTATLGYGYLVFVILVLWKARRLLRMKLEPPKGAVVTRVRLAFSTGPARSN